MKLSRKAVHWIAAALLIFLGAQLVHTLIISEGEIFTFQNSAHLCADCGVKVHFRRIEIFKKLATDELRHETTALHLFAFAETPHSESHRIETVLEHAETSLTLDEGLVTFKWTNNSPVVMYPSTNLNGSITGLSSPNNSIFAPSFQLLQLVDRTWSQHQWTELLKPKLPHVLLPFKTNNDAQGFFQLLKAIDLSSEKPRDDKRLPLLGK